MSHVPFHFGAECPRALIRAAERMSAAMKSGMGAEALRTTLELCTAEAVAGAASVYGIRPKCRRATDYGDELTTFGTAPFPLPDLSGLFGMEFLGRFEPEELAAQRMLPMLFVSLPFLKRVEICAVRMRKHPKYRAVLLTWLMALWGYDTCSMRQDAARNKILAIARYDSLRTILKFVRRVQRAAGRRLARGASPTGVGCSVVDPYRGGGQGTDSPTGAGRRLARGASPTGEWGGEDASPTGHGEALVREEFERFVVEEEANRKRPDWLSVEEFCRNEDWAYAGAYDLFIPDHGPKRITKLMCALFRKGSGPFAKMVRSGECDTMDFAIDQMFLYLVARSYKYDNLRGKALKCVKALVRKHPEVLKAHDKSGDGPLWQLLYSGERTPLRHLGPVADFLIRKGCDPKEKSSVGISYNEVVKYAAALTGGKITARHGGEYGW